jgi:alpha-N-arabinofuranosidase
MESLVVQQRAAMDVFDPSRRIGLIVDEWGTWHPVEKGTNPAFLYQQNSIRDALVAATTLDIFNRHSDKVVMANIAQTVNVLQSVVLTEGEQMLVTPTGYVYEMYAPHQGAAAVRMLVETPNITYQSNSSRNNSVNTNTGEQTLPMLGGSASLRDSKLFISLTNSHAEDGAQVFVDIPGIPDDAVISGRILSGEIHAHNTFTNPNKVRPGALTVNVDNHKLRLDLPPASVSALEIQLA